MPETTELVKVSEAAARLGVSRSTITRWAADGLIPCVQFPNGSYRIPVAEIDRILSVQPARNSA